MSFPSMTDKSRAHDDPYHQSSSSGYWASSLRIVSIILVLWFTVSLGCGILFREWLDANLPNVGGAPLGFWMSQQGAILGFLGLLVLYMWLMNRLDRQHGFDEIGVNTNGRDGAEE